MARTAAQEETASDVWKQADIGFWHGHSGVFSDDACCGALGNTHAAAHHNPIHESNVRLGIGLNQMIEGVFLSEKIIQSWIASQSRLVKKADIATGAKAAEEAFWRAWAPGLVGSSDRNRHHGRIISPSPQRQK